MLLPRVSLRWLLGLTAAAAVYFLVVSFALNGRVWAIAVSVGVAAVLLTLLAYAATCAVGWVFVSIEDLLRPPPKAESPFATSAPPPQIIPPEDPQ